MATFTRPGFTEILNSVQADINARLPGADATLRYSLLNVIAYMVAGVAYGLYSFIGWVALQVFPDTAESEYLRCWGAIWGVEPIVAQPASGNIDVTGVNDTVIPLGTELSRSDNLIFETTAEQIIAAGVATLPVIAQTTGEISNTAATTVLTFVTPLANVSNTGVVDGDALTGGVDDEDDDSYRTRLLNRIQNPPQGGSASDYITWALEVPGVTRAWVYPLEDGPGTVTVRFMMDDTYDDGIPESGDVDTVQDYIDDRRPVTADVTVAAPTADPLNFTIHLSGTDTSTIRAAVEASLRDMIVRDSEPGGTIYISRIHEAISLAPGEFDHTLTVPAANVTHSADEIATMGTITWT